MTRSPIELSAGQLKKDIAEGWSGPRNDWVHLKNHLNGSSATFIYFCILAQVYNVSHLHSTGNYSIQLYNFDLGLMSHFYSVTSSRVMCIDTEF